MSDINIDATNPVNRLALRAGEGVAKQSNKITIDPMVIIAIAQIIAEIIAMINECQKTPQQRLALLRSPGILARRKLKRLILAKADDKSDLGKYLSGQLVEVAKAASDEELAVLFPSLEG